MVHNRYLKLLTQTFDDWMTDDAPKMAASLSFYMVFAIAPLVLLTVSLASFVFGRELVQDQVSAQLTNFFGSHSAETILAFAASARQHGGGVLSGVLSVITMFIGASAVFAEMQESLNKVWDVETIKYSALAEWAYKRLIAAGMIMFIGVLLLSSVVISAVLNVGADWIQNYWNINGVLLTLSNFLISFSLMTLIFAVMFKFLPQTKVEWKDVFLGAAITALLFNLGKSLISIYITKSAVASSYGAAGSLILILLWVYYNAQVFFLGAEFTHAYSKLWGSLKSTR